MLILIFKALHEDFSGGGGEDEDYYRQYVGPFDV